MRRKPRTPTRPVIRLSLRCSCGGTLSGEVSAPFLDVVKIRDIFLSFHREDGHVVTDASEDADA